jgi:hypothetical protein
MRWGNCYVFVLRQWWRKGGYVVLSRSKYGWWLHAVWSRDLVTFEDFVPLGPKRRRKMPPIWFAGRVRVTQPARQGA